LFISSIKDALGRVDNVLFELHMTFLPVDFIIMDGKNHSPIILGKPFLKTTCAMINAKQRECEVLGPTQKVHGELSKKEGGSKELPPLCVHLLKL
jgi:hypothetical protein